MLDEEDGGTKGERRRRARRREGHCHCQGYGEVISDSMPRGATPPSWCTLFSREHDASSVLPPRFLSNRSPRLQLHNSQCFSRGFVIFCCSSDLDLFGPFGNFGTVRLGDLAGHGEERA